MEFKTIKGSRTEEHPQKTDYFLDFFRGDEMITDMGKSLCEPDTTMEELEENFHIYQHIIDDEKALRLVNDLIASTRPRSRCPMTMKKIELLASKKLDRLANYVSSLIIFNADGENSEEIYRWAKPLHVDQIARAIMSTVDILKELQANRVTSSTTSSTKMTVENVYSGIIKSFPLLFGRANVGEIPEVLERFLRELDYTNKSGHGPTPDQIIDALSYVGIITREESLPMDEGEENSDDEKDDDYDNDYLW